MRATWLVVGLVAGCSEPSSPPPAEPKPTAVATSTPMPGPPPSPPPPPSPAASPSPALPPAPAASGEVPKRMALLGVPCVVTPPRDTRIFCNRSGRVGAVVVPVDMVDGVPPAIAEKLGAWDDKRNRRTEHLEIAREGQRLWVQHVTCGNCRRVMGHAFVVDLDRMDEKALEVLQNAVGLPPSPVLKTAEAWRDAYRARFDAD